jgi:hypothetical protein
VSGSLHQRELKFFHWNLDKFSIQEVLPDARVTDSGNGLTLETNEISSTRATAR